MDGQLSRALQIRYIKLHFKISFTVDATLPTYKTSMLRGGIGEMLLRANCISDRECGSCGFEPECIVRRTMYSKFDKKPDYVTSGDSIGYVLECEDYRAHFPKGSTLSFCLVLFGKTIVYFNQYLQAVSMLGMHGVGSGHARFVIVSIKNSCFQDILNGNDILMKNYRVQTVSDYVARRMGEMDGTEDTLVFHTPTALKSNKEFLQEFRMDAILGAVKRRIHMLDCFEGIDNDFYQSCQVPVPKTVSQQQRHMKVRRHSSRKGPMSLRGIIGSVQLEGIHPDTLPLLLGGELVHIGKNTSFGFGRYQITR